MGITGYIMVKSGTEQETPATKHIYIAAGKDPAPQQTENSATGDTTQATIPSTSSRDTTRPQSSGCAQAILDYITT